MIAQLEVRAKSETSRLQRFINFPRLFKARHWPTAAPHLHPGASSPRGSWSARRCNAAPCCRCRRPCWRCGAGRRGRHPWRRSGSPPPWRPAPSSGWTRGTIRAEPYLHRLSGEGWGGRVRTQARAVEYCQSEYSPGLYCQRPSSRTDEFWERCMRPAFSHLACTFDEIRNYSLVHWLK